MNWTDIDLLISPTSTSILAWWIVLWNKLLLVFVRIKFQGIGEPYSIRSWAKAKFWNLKISSRFGDSIWTRWSHEVGLRFSSHMHNSRFRFHSNCCNSSISRPWHWYRDEWTEMEAIQAGFHSSWEDTEECICRNKLGCISRKKSLGFAQV